MAEVVDAVRHWETGRDPSAVLLGWLRAPREDAGLWIIGGAGRWEHTPYPRLADEVQWAAGELIAQGVQPGDRVCLCIADPEGFIITFFAVLRAGASVVPVAPFGLAGGEHVHDIAAMLRAARPHAAVLEDGVSQAFLDVLAQDGSMAPRVLAVPGTAPRTVVPPAGPVADVALIQFTSGSTGRPSAITVAAEHLARHTDAIVDWLPSDRRTAVASWLPLHHDMGLVGLMISAICTQVGLWQMRPEQFLAHPDVWLDVLGTGAATITAAPPFAYEYAARRVTDEQAASWDFSGMHVAIVGAERLVPAPLTGFIERFREHGLHASVLAPAYGLAEATLAVTAHRGARPASCVAIDFASLTFGEPVTWEAAGTIGATSRTEGNGERGALVSSGTPLLHTTLRIVDEEGRTLPAGTLGEIEVSSPTVATRFDLDDIEPAGPLRTGDAGFLSDGELFVVGRLSDGINVHGRRLHAEHVEAVIAAELAIAPHRCMAFADLRRPGEHLVVLIETAGRVPAADGLARVLRSTLGSLASASVHAVPRGALLRTTSGKPRRRLMSARFAAGEIEQTTILTAPATQVT